MKQSQQVQMLGDVGGVAWRGGGDIESWLDQYIRISHDYL